MSEYHNPVLLKESVDALMVRPGGIYADATFGGGGHSREIVSRCPGRLIAFDRDSEAAANAIDDPRFTLVCNNFRFIHNYALLEGVSFDGIIADLGVSSHQFDTAGRGFSFRFEDSPLDMRMNSRGEKTASDIVNTYPVEDLERLFRLYGELQNARRLALLIDNARQAGRIRTTTDLSEAIGPALPSFAAHKYLAKVYQALRIEVNSEMRSLEKMLKGATLSLRKGGRLVVITYHSLEDRMVKNWIKTGSIDGDADRDLIYGGTTAPLKAVNRKPILPSEQEISSNTRARSAKLRIAEKVL